MLRKEPDRSGDGEKHHHGHHESSLIRSKKYYSQQVRNDCVLHICIIDSVGLNHRLLFRQF